jgi:hypothetical protein
MQMPLAPSLSKCGGKEYAWHDTLGKLKATLWPNVRYPWLHSNMASYKT